MTREELMNRLLSIDKQISTRSWITAGGDLGDLIDELREETNHEPSLPSDLDKAAHHSAVAVLNNPAFLPNAPFSEILKILDGLFKAGAEWKAGQGWHDVTETPSIFGFYLVIHEKGWCVANYMGKGTVCESGWVEAIHHIEIEHPKKWLDLRDLIPKNSNLCTSK